MDQKEIKKLMKKGNDALVDEDYDTAKEFYDKVLVNDSNNVDALVRRAQVNHMLKSYSEAVDDAERAIQLDRNHLKAFFRKGISLYALSEFENAKECFDKCLELDKDDKFAKVWLRKSQTEIEAKTNPEIKNIVVTKVNPTNFTADEIQLTGRIPEPEEPPKYIPHKDRIRYDWYQNNKNVIIDVFVKKRTRDQVKINIESNKIDISIETDDKDMWELHSPLAAEIDVENSSFEIGGVKIELVLKKKAPLNWPSLDKAELEAPMTIPPAYPVTPKTDPKKWDNIEVEPDAEPEGDEALGKLFRSIYACGSDETKKAMIKSFTESGGTVLSTDWDEVGAKKVEGSAPKGAEMKKWET